MRRPAPDAGRTRLTTFLYGCSKPALDHATVAELAGRYRVETKVVEYELTIARQKRAGEGA